MSKTLFITVLLDQNVQKPLDYEVPFSLQSQVSIGVRVEVPLKNRAAKGTIVGVHNTSSFGKPKALLKILPPQGELSSAQWKLAEWMSYYYSTPLQKVLKCFIPPHIRKDVKQKTKLFLTLRKTDKETIQVCEQLRIKAPKQAAVLDKLLQASKGIFLSELLKELPSPQAVQTLITKGWIQAKPLEDALLLEEEFFLTQPKSLNPEQAATLSKIETALQKNTFSSHLIYGVTGSGKTEIYLQAIAKTLELGKSAILLVPEIALTSQTIERFRSRFPQKLAILHHKRSLGERATAWEDLRTGKVQIAIGARSAIFCPIQNLGLIIIDEEHDGSYKQSDDPPCYQGRDVAVMRAHLEKCVILLGSATPSCESRYNADIGKYELHTLQKRATNANLPQVRVVDMQRALERNGGFTHFSDELLTGMKERLRRGEQTLLLLNKRGYHRMQMCKDCKSVVLCPHCDLSLTYHKEAGELKCHMCHYVQPPIKICPTCKGSHSIEFKGFGTEHVEKSLYAILPEVRILRMDRDTTQKKHSHEEIFEQFRAHKADVLIGTQMIAKGFHFPSVTLVGVLNLDASLNIPDFRAPEHVFQLLIQVAGRAGRAELPGEVILQTFLPDHPVIQMAKGQEYEPFYQTLLAERKHFDYPPFAHFAKLKFSAKEADTALKTAEEVREQLLKILKPPVQIFPVSTAGHPKTKDLYHFQFLIKTPKISAIAKALSEIPPNIAKIDIDPISTFF